MLVGEMSSHRHELPTQSSVERRRSHEKAWFYHSGEHGQAGGPNLLKFNCHMTISGLNQAAVAELRAPGAASGSTIRVNCMDINSVLAAAHELDTPMPLPGVTV